MLVKFINEYRGFEIVRTIDGSFRVTKIGSETDQHTHLESKRACFNVVDDVLAKKLPLKRCKWYIISLIRLTDDIEYKQKLEDILLCREQRGKKERYINNQKVS
jgi:hypothetical protein